MWWSNEKLKNYKTKLHPGPRVWEFPGILEPVPLVSPVPVLPPLEEVEEVFEPEFGVVVSVVVSAVVDEGSFDSGDFGDSGDSVF